MRAHLFEDRLRQVKAASVLRRLCVAGVLILAALHLRGAAVSPGSFADLTEGGGRYVLALDDGTHVSVYADGSSLPFFPGVRDEKFIDPFYDDGGSDVSIVLNSEPLPDGRTGSYFVFTGPPISTAGDVGSGPFSFYGLVVEHYDGGRRLEFAGRGTVYFTFSYFEDVFGPRREIANVRYEFEEMETVPEGSSWALFLFGTGRDIPGAQAAYWAEGWAPGPPAVWRNTERPRR